jgi:predicted esterase
MERDPKMNRAGPLTLKLTALFALLAMLFAPQASAAGDTRYKDEIFKKVKTKTDIVYGNAAGSNGEPQDLKLDLFEPKGDEINKRPAVIWVHGGGFGFGDKADGPSPILAKEFARRGYVTASINYRLLAPGGCTGANITPECYSAAIEGTHDAQAAVRFLRANAKQYGVDKKRIGIGGESAGAIISCGVGVLSADPGSSGNPGPSSAVQGFVSISGGLPDGVFVDASTAPGILFASTQDPIVPYSWSPETVDKMVSFGVPAKLTTFESTVHVPFDEFRSTIEKQTTKFLYKQLDAAGAKG